MSLLAAVWQLILVQKQGEDNGYLKGQIEIKKLSVCCLEI